VNFWGPVATDARNTKKKALKIDSCVS
jgi:hypothetical protein